LSKLTNAARDMPRCSPRCRSSSNRKAAAEAAAKADNTTRNQFISVAVAEKVAAFKTADCFAERARRADFDGFDRIMNRKGGEPPRVEDRD
jgi:hypothetical protein